MLLEKVSPIKRSEELVLLSREHHDGLLLCWKIRMGVRNSVDVDRIAKYVVNFFDRQLCRHFDEEEDNIFPLLDPGNENRIEAELQHTQLRDMIYTLRTNNENAYLHLSNFSDLLNKHIRFEERTLFGLIERVTDKITLKEATIGYVNVDHSDDEHDKFWLKENE